jgi:hypothetical protein
MVKPRCALLAVVLLLTAGCSDGDLPLDPLTTPPPSADATEDSVAAPPADGVGTFGEIRGIKPQGQGLVLYQTGLEFEGEPGVRVNNARHELAVGARHQELQVQIRDTTEIWVNGKRATVDSLWVGMRVLVVGRVTGAALHADQIMDLTDAGPPPADWEALVPIPPSPEVTGVALGPVVQATSMCMGQRLPYADSNVLDFQGCWGGPSAADHINTGFIPIFCPIIGCFGIDRLSYMAALAGWGFAFPFRFEATPPEALVYHVPGAVDLKITPLPAGDAVSFWGGLGLEFGIGFRWCGIFGCYDLGMKYLSLFTTSNQSSGAAPLTGQYLDIATTSCPSVGVVPIENFPLNPLEIGFCQDLDLEGRSFDTRVYAPGAESPWLGVRSFGPEAIRATVRPVDMAVNVRYDSYEWVPELKQSLFFRFKSFTIRLYDTPAIPLGSGAWHAITTPFPLGFPFSLATDPRSPVDDLRYLAHPTESWVTLEVDPAPTLLSITSGSALAEGNPVTAWLREEYLDAAIVGAVVVIEAAGLNGTPSATFEALTDGTGTAAVILPPGEYDITARYEGGETYLPSSARMAPVTVYMPTTFVIWGGNTEGIEVGTRYNFWGPAWVKQVTGGAYDGSASFKGFAVPDSDVSWLSPGSSAAMPATLADVISVLVTTRVSGRGALSQGNITGHVVLRVEGPERYRPASGHAMWGVMRMWLP